MSLLDSMSPLYTCLWVHIIVWIKMKICHFYRYICLFLLNLFCEEILLPQTHIIIRKCVDVLIITDILLGLTVSGAIKDYDYIHES
jgi:hypothetical protein